MALPARLNPRSSTTGWLRVFALLFVLALVAACGGRQQNADALDAARAAVDGAADTERCAQAEYRAARDLLAQAEAAWEAGDHDRARSLAAAAAAQAETARRAAEANAEDCDRLQRVETPPAVTPPPTPPPAVAVDANYQLERIYFPFNESGLSDEARAILDRHAAWLNANPTVHFRIEGHCDEKGSTEYNLALGETRARAVRAYLQRLGVAPERMTVVSYGEEMPLGADDNRNRRAEFVRR